MALLAMPPVLCMPAEDSKDSSSTTLPVLLTVRAPASDYSISGSSEEPEGGSPVQQLVCGPHAYRVHRQRRGLGWVLRQLRKQQQRRDADSPSLVSGSSYDSLCSLESSAQAPTPAAAEPVSQQPSATTSSTTDSGEPAAPEGFLRRVAKAVLRPVVRAVVGAARVVASSAGPQGPGNNDNSMAERIINVLTSVPFFVVGLHGLRNRRCPKGRHYALSFLVLGAVASGYHGADRQSWLRPVMRKLDYYSICYTSTVLRRAAHISLPNAAKAAAVFIAPFKPSIVTGLNLALVEGKFLKQALQHSHLRRSFKTHLGSAAVGMACFAYEDVATGWGWPPVLHSLWHCLSAVAMGCVHGLLEHLELAMLVQGVQLAGGSS